MSRAGVRAEFERRFTAESMARDYVGAYRALACAQRGARCIPSAAGRRAPRRPSTPSDSARAKHP